jgi:hypothetical protein
LRLLLALALATLSLLARTLLGNAASFFCRLLASLLFFGTTEILGLNPFALTALVLNTLRLATYHFFGLAPLGVDFVLLLTSLFFENVALDIRALTAHLNIHCASAPLRAGQLEFLLRLALECDLARCRIAVVSTTVATPKVREQLELCIVADAIVRSVHFDTCLIELHEQPVNGNLENFRKLGNCYFCHRHPLLARFEPMGACRHDELAGFVSLQPVDIRQIVDRLLCEILARAHASAC